MKNHVNLMPAGINKYRSRVIPGLLTLLILGACSTPPNEVFINRAQVIANELIDTMADERYADSVRFYDPRFFERVTPAEWQLILERLTEKLGKYQSRKLTASSVSHGFNRTSTVTTVLVYHIRYQRDYTIQKFTFMSDEKAENMKLVGHYIDFPQQQ